MGDQRGGPQRPWWMSPTASSRARRSRRRPTRAGTGWCQLPHQYYDVSLKHRQLPALGRPLGDLPLDFYALPEDLEKPRSNSPRLRGCWEAYRITSASILFRKDGYKLIQCLTRAWSTRARSLTATASPTAIWSATGPASASARASESSSSTKAGHEWFGNSIQGADVFRHVGSTRAGPLIWSASTWSTCGGADDALKYINGYKSKVRNLQPNYQPRAASTRKPPQDQYFKGAAFSSTPCAAWWMTTRAGWRPIHISTSTSNIRTS